MTLYYRGHHRTQYDGSAKANSNCTPTTGANGARCSTGGAIDLSGGQVRALLPRYQEQNPFTPGWSLWDLEKAMTRLGVPFDIMTGSGGGWSNLVRWLNSAHFVALPGDSDVMPNGTCSGTYDGGHCIGVHPDQLLSREYLIGDPLCRDWRSEDGYTLARYGIKWAHKQAFAFGVFMHPVPALQKPGPPEVEMNGLVTSTKGEDWKVNAATDAQGRPYRDAPDRQNAHILGYIKKGQIVRSIAEAKTKDGNLWRMTERNGKTVWLLREDFEPLVQGGDPAVDAELTNYIARV